MLMRKWPTVIGCFFLSSCTGCRLEFLILNVNYLGFWLLTQYAQDLYNQDFTFWGNLVFEKIQNTKFKNEKMLIFF